MSVWLQSLDQARELSRLSTTELLAAGLLFALAGWGYTLHQFFRREVQLVSLLLQASQALATQIQTLQEIPRALEKLIDALSEHREHCRDSLNRVEQVMKNFPGQAGAGPSRR